MREREQLKKQAVSSLQKIEKWYNDRKQKAMESYISQSKIKILEGQGKAKVMKKRQESIAYMDGVKGRFEKFVRAFKAKRVNRKRMTEIKIWAA